MYLHTKQYTLTHTAFSQMSGNVAPDYVSGIDTPTCRSLGWPSRNLPAPGAHPRTAADGQETQRPGAARRPPPGGTSAHKAGTWPANCVMM